MQALHIVLSATIGTSLLLAACDGGDSSSKTDSPLKKMQDADKANTRAELAKAGAKNINQALQTYLLDQGMSSPGADFDFEVLVLSSSNGGGPGGPYLDAEDLKDPWGNQYMVLIPGEVNRDWDIVSYGADGAYGGSGENADITN